MDAVYAMEIFSFLYLTALCSTVQLAEICLVGHVILHGF